MNKRTYKFLIALSSVIVVIATIFWYSNLQYKTAIKNKLEVKAYAAIIIDDFGNHGNGYQEMLALDIPLTVAVMPFMPYSKEEAELAHQMKKEVILHLPMEPINGQPHWLGPRGITCDLSDDEIKNRVTDGLKELKWAKGINNHMGSRATADTRVMKNIIEIVKQNNLYYVDSRTTMDTVAEKTALSQKATAFRRNVFLDNIKSQVEIEKQMELLGDTALKNGYAIAIGHVGVEGGMITVDAIKNKYPELQAKGIEFVTVSQLKNLAK